MIRCDDIFVDSDFSQFEKICQIIRRYDFNHLIGITPLGEGKKLWTRKRSLWKIPLYKFLVNYRIKRMTGEKFVGDNVELMKILDTEFKKYEAIPALHGLYHYRYDRRSQNNVYEELSIGIELLKKLFDLRVMVFTPPFNAWNRGTELVCKRLNLSIDKCITGFDTLIMNMNSCQIKELARQQSSVPEVFYHPHCILNLEKFELYLKTRRKYS